MSVTQTMTWTEAKAEAMSDLQRRLQPQVGAPGGPGQQLRFRPGVSGVTGVAKTISTSTAPNATLARRFSFVWPFISKETAALRSRCSQLHRQSPFLGGRPDQALRSGRSVRDLISRVLSQLKAVWLVLAVYMSLVVLTGLCSLVLYTFILANKPPGLWFLAACVAATGAIAGVSFSARERAPRSPRQQQQQQRRS